MSDWPELVQTVVGFPFYVVCGDGRVRNQSGQWLKPQRRNGYLRVQLTLFVGSRRWRRQWRPVHTIVLEAFVGPRPSPRHHGAHKDGDRGNNRVDNLVWKLPPDNEADKKLHGTAPKGGAQQRLHPLRRRAIVRRVARGESRTRVGARFGIHRSTVTKVLARVGAQV